jgi:3-oxoadipate enol-lactonase
MAADTLAAMDAANVVVADIVGFSMGARIAIELCLAHPQRVRTLTLIAGRAAGRSRRRTRLLARLAAAAQRDGGRGMRRQLEAGNGYDVRWRLAQVSVPTLVLHGQHDRVVPVADSRELARHIPAAELDLMPGGISPSCEPKRSRTPSALTPSPPKPGRYRRRTRTSPACARGCLITPRRH